MNTFMRDKRDQSNITSDFKQLVLSLRHGELTRQQFVAMSREAGAFEAEVIEALVELED